MTDIAETAENVTVVAFERQVKHGLAASLVFGTDGTPDRAGWFAKVECAGFTLHCSRLDGETGWIADAQFRHGCPIFVNGFGYRASRLVAPAAFIEDVLNLRLPS